mgnify:CR=1 FL=1
MNKGDLVSEVSQVLASKKDAQAAIDTLLAAITKALKKGEDVTLVRLRHPRECLHTQLMHGLEGLSQPDSTS